MIRNTFGHLDALVNNAATQNPSPLLELKESDWDHVLAVNLKAPFLCAQQAAPLMQAVGGGKIVNISSVHATDPKRNFAHYSSSKAGLEMLSKCMALELAQYNIQANSIIVGAIGTEMTPPERQAIVDTGGAGRANRRRRGNRPPCGLPLFPLVRLYDRREHCRGRRSDNAGILRVSTRTVIVKNS